MFCTWPYFKSEGFWNSEVAYSASTSTRIHATNLQQHPSRLRHTIEQSAVRPTFRDATWFPCEMASEKRAQKFHTRLRALVHQTPRRGETSGGVAKCRLFSQATTISFTMFQATSSGRNVAFVFYKNTFSRSMRMKKVNWPSLRSRRLEVVGTRKNGRARRRHPSRASVLSFAHYFQAPATQAMIDPDNQVIILKSSLLHIQHQVALQVRWGSHQLKSLSKL